MKRGLSELAFPPDGARHPGKDTYRRHQRRRLARAVGAKEREDLPRGEGERHAAHGGEVAVPRAQVAYLEHNAVTGRATRWRPSSRDSACLSVLLGSHDPSLFRRSPRLRGTDSQKYDHGRMKIRNAQLTSLGARSDVKAGIH